MRQGLAGLFVLVCALAVGCVDAIDASSSADVGADSEALRRSQDCALVLCALPDCGEHQQVSLRGGCCPVCVGTANRCIDVLCPRIACAEGETLVTTPGDCCGHCVPEPRAQECQTDLDCPQYYCITCPCPTSECRGGQCFTTTPDESTCGGSTL
jgi:hypothetical protein